MCLLSKLKIVAGTLLLASTLAGGSMLAMEHFADKMLGHKIAVAIGGM
jgi:hypothetical protein